jgi:asparaginyl-tRNA synthetase
MRAGDVKSGSFSGKEVTIRGWVHRLRKQKERAFILLRDDRGGVIQCVLPADRVADLTIESSVEITGTVSKDERAPEGGYEIKGTDIKVYNIAQEYPIGEYQSDELLLDKRLRLGFWPALVRRKRLDGGDGADDSKGRRRGRLHIVQAALL